jgi:heme-degrading monooxygenase HmoA
VNPVPDTDGQGVIAQITLTVRPEHQQALIDVLRSAGDPADIPGLRSITLLRDLDGTRVINQMHWASRAAFDEARATLAVVRDTRAEVARLVERATTAVHEVIALG